MEKWSFDALEGHVKRCAVNEEVIIIEDEFINPNSCSKCRTLEERIRILEAELENEKKNHEMMKTEYSKFVSFSERTQAELTKKHQDLLSIIHKHLTEKNIHMRAILARLREK